MNEIGIARIEAYARARVSGMTRRDAYLSLSGVSANRSSAGAQATLYEKKAAARIEELRTQGDGAPPLEPVPAPKQVARATVMNPPRGHAPPMSRQAILDGLSKIANAPDNLVRANDRRQALMDMARMEGHVIERMEHGRPGDFSKLSEPELDAEIGRLSALVGFSGHGTMTEGHDE